MTRPFVLLIIGISLISHLAIGVFMLWLGLSKENQSKASEHWPSVPGVVTRSEVIRERDSEGNTSFSALVTYDYQVGEEDFTAERVQFSFNSAMTASEADMLVENYPTRAEVEVFYDPQQPREAVLVPGRPAGVNALLIVAIVFFTIIPVFTLLFGFIILQRIR